jgi:hypothetical protein
MSSGLDSVPLASKGTIAENAGLVGMRKTRRFHTPATDQTRKTMNSIERNRTVGIGLADIRFDNHGSIILLAPLSPAGREWLEASVSAESWQWLCGALAVEPRYAGAVLEGALDAGLEVE